LAAGLNLTATTAAQSVVRPPAQFAVATSAARRLIVRGEQVKNVLAMFSESNDI